MRTHFRIESVFALTVSVYLAGCTKEPSASDLASQTDPAPQATSRGNEDHLIVPTSPPTPASSQTTLACLPKWSNLDEFSLSAPDSAVASSVVSDQLGNTYVSGFANDPNGSHWVNRKSTDGGKTWITVDDFQYSLGMNTRSNAVGIDSQGLLIQVGSTYTGSGLTERWLVRKSGNRGTSWTSIDDFQLLGSNFSHALGFGADQLGNMFLLGEGYDGTDYHWIIRQSSNSGSSWTVVDDYQLVSGQFASAAAFAKDLEGSLYIAGSARGTSGPTDYHWIIRKKSASGGTWSTIDDFQMQAGNATTASAMVSESSKTIYIAGYWYDGAYDHWLVRKSTDGGLSWANVDDFQYSSNKHSMAYGITISPAGKIYVSGWGYAGSSYHWLIRSSLDHGLSWVTEDDFQPTSGQDCRPHGVGLDPQGHPVAIGDCSISGTVKWITRASSCQ